MKTAQRPVAFVALRDEILAARVPVRVGAEDWDFRTDVMRWVQTAFAQNVRGHRRRGGFSVHSGDDDPTLAAHDGSERLGPAHHRLSRRTRTEQNRVVAL